MNKNKILALTSWFLFTAITVSACTSHLTSSGPVSDKVQDVSNNFPEQATQDISSPESVSDANVLFVEADFDGETWRFTVTVYHPDTGWEDYANGWDLVTPDGSVIKHHPDDPFTRTLQHPHENEQPFSRSQSGLILPGGVNQVTVRAHDLLDGFGGQEITLDLKQTSGDGYQVVRSQPDLDD
jgi:hypothetical protein